MRDITNWALLCTTNDPESLTIVRIAQELRIPLLKSEQVHGATLAKEPRLFDRIEQIQGIKHVVIVEIPGIEEEKRIADLGIEVHIIDHHTYADLDRMQNEASLTQFRELFEIADEDLRFAGFDPEVIRGVALIDQGFLWELTGSELSLEKQRAARAYYLSCKRDIDSNYSDTEEAALAAWQTKEIKDDVVIIRSASPHHVREAVSFLIADAFPEAPPTSIIVEGDGRVSVQETNKAEELFVKFGGFLFGKKRCWGVTAKNRPPNVDEIMANIRQ